ncbi:hypothetical protein CLAFUW4_10682 [Fulvia fulva]|uniref:Uncharacterized protein n=1 Tax=Passalora fulva TaxID=5499 RepID=A0A9Q8P7G0_PASFU|nr:uncharacterized protein CLAFUR5_05296 [Fulvia fulva]KAK4616284.1 hypothetical protein CLAFUR4_10687 [Fulvia fulva]KAK4617190.1 hypothetical protein CLAFUR0_10556 [Fulvia fulva]UJO15857.1 hypothetical protein CLAFUR5_05296 [Fulvia fulva]WPV19609.1 hypothetical protein CLAFUW4_10682 [Fulvia fulva]WPV33885.1 hypothetical protein CLAFUW7_10684 [Fulvia fulva]
MPARVWVNPNATNSPTQARLNSLDTRIADIRQQIAEKEMSGKTKREFDIALEALGGTNLAKD